MRRKIVFSALALAVIALPATAQNQWLTGFKDSGGDHIYYQGIAPSPSGHDDLWQIAPTFPWSGDMNQLTVCSGMGNPPPYTNGDYPSPLASFTNARGQHVFS